MTKLYSLITFWCIAFTAWAQPQIQWQKTVGGRGTEIARQILRTKDGGYLVAATATLSDGDVSGVHSSIVSTLGPDGTTFYDEDIWLFKLNSQQQIIWSKCLGGNSSDLPRQIFETTNGEIVVIAETGSSNLGGRYPGSGDALIVRLTADGNLLWQQVIGGNGIDRPYSGLETLSGDLIIVGYTESSSGDVQNYQGNGDGWVFCLTAGGTLRWKQCIGTTNYERLHAIAPSGNGYLVFGQTAQSEYNKQSTRLWVIRFTSEGNVIWQRYPANLALPVAVSSLGTDFVLAGYTFRQTLDGTRYDVDLWMSRVDSTATLRWERTFGGLGDDAASSVVTLPDGSILVGGSSSSNEGDVLGKHATPADNWLLDVDGTGTLRGQYCIGGSQAEGGVYSGGFVDDKLYSYGSLALDADGGILWASFSQSSDGDLTQNRSYLNRPTKDVWVVKLAAESPTALVIDPLQPVSFCSRQLTVPFHSDQAFGTNSSFTVELSDRNGTFVRPVTLPVQGSQSPLTVTLPDTLTGGFGYRIRLTTSSPALTSAPSNRFNPNTSPSATVSGNSTVKSGDGAILQLNFRGGPPYSYTLSNGQALVTNTESITVAVTTLTPTVYTVHKVANQCGLGLTSGQANVDVLYCTPYVYHSCQNSVRIEDFQVQTETGSPLLVNTGSGCSTSNHGDYTRLTTAPLARLSQYQFTARVAGLNNNGNNLAVFVDYNQDRQFSTDELVYQQSFSQSSMTVKGSLVVPSSAKTGSTRLRVYMRNDAANAQTDACYAYNYGEYEDYTLYIQDSGAADLSVRLVANSSVINLNQPVTLTAYLTNEGDQEATQISLSHQLPANLQLLTSSDWSAGQNRELTSSVTSLQPGEVKALTFQALPTAVGIYQAWVQVTRSGRYDPDSRPNSGTQDGEDDAAVTQFRTLEGGNSLFVSPNPNQLPLATVASNQPKPDPTKADLSLHLQLSNATPKLNELTSLSLIVSNQGGLSTGGISLRLTLPVDVYVVADGQPIANSYVVSLPGSIAVGATGIITLALRGGQTGNALVKAEIVSADQLDPDSILDNGPDNGEDDTAWCLVRVR